MTSKWVQDFSLQERALHELAKACWGNYSMPVEDCPLSRIKIMAECADCSYIKRHREAVLSNVSELFSSTLPKTLRDKLKNAVIRLQRGYREALVCTGPYEHTHGLFMPSPLTAGPYSAKNFIDPSGRFNELAWAKQFISDDKISIYYRFELACFFCFEETIRELWSSMKNNGSSRYSESLNDNFKYGHAVGIWICHVENKFHEYDDSDSFYLSGLKDAFDIGHEYAARFFWTGCTDEEKDEFMADIRGYFHAMACFASHENPGILNFAYSLLPEKEKAHLFYHMSDEFYAEILQCLLHSSFYKTVLSDILYSPLLIECLDYTYFLDILSVEMAEIPLQEYEEIFLEVWILFIQGRPKFIPKYVRVIHNLIAIKAEELIRKIIQPLYYIEKVYLLHNIPFRVGGKSVWHDDYDALLRYLLLFLIDLDTETQTFSVNSGYIDFLKVVCEKHNLKEIDVPFIKPASDTLEIRKVIDNIQGSFEVLNYLLPLVEEMVSTLKPKIRRKRANPSS